MKIWTIIIRVILVVISLAVLAFNTELYLACKEQRTEIDAMNDQQKAEALDNSNKYKYQHDQIEGLAKDLASAQEKIKDQSDALDQQKDAFLQEVEKRQQVENENQNIQTSLVDIRAEADAIKQDMKGWQKDYVAVLVQLEKKMDESQAETKNLESNLTALNIPDLKENINALKSEIEKMTTPQDNTIASTPPPAIDNSLSSTVTNAAQ